MTGGRYRDRVAVVTGASRGIGAAIAATLARQGAKVYCVYRSADTRFSALKDGLGEFGGNLFPVRIDLTEPNQIDEFFKQEDFCRGRLDILVNCAGGSADALLLRASAKRVREALALNLESAISCSRSALPYMLRARYGRIVNIGSVVASMGNAGQSLYCAAKAGLEGFTRSLAREVGSRGITINCVSPGFIETDMTAAMSEAQRGEVLKATAVGRLGSVEDVAWAVQFLCDEASSYVTGAVLHVNGGMYM